MHRLVAGLIALVLSADLAALVVMRDDPIAAAPPLSAAFNVTTTSAPPTDSVVFREEFSAGSVFQPDEDDIRVITVEGNYRVRFKGARDLYFSIPERAPESARIQQTDDVSVAIEARNASGDPGSWFGVFCRFLGLGSDMYLGTVRSDGSWAIYRATISTPYVRRLLASGRTPGLDVVQPPHFVFRIRLECVGLGPTALHLYVNDREVGLATDPSGLGPGSVGLAVSSTTGELVLDNLVVAEIP